MAGLAITKPKPKKIGTSPAINESRRVKKAQKLNFLFKCLSLPSVLSKSI